MSSTPTPRRRGSAWDKLAAKRVAMGRAADEPCRLCGGAIDYSVSGRHPMGPTAEHSQSVAATGNVIVPIEQLFVAHRQCQDRQGGRRAAKAGGVGKPSVKPERVQPAVISKIGMPTPIFKSGHGEPRIFSDRHPDAVDSLAEKWLAHLKDLGFTARPWQAQVLERALEVDADGRFCWREVVVSTPRQSGKSFLIYAICMARAGLSHMLSGGAYPQEIIHVANNLAAARRIQQIGWRYAQGAKVSKSIGQERITWPDGSVWALVATSAVWGWSASLAVVDEAWDVRLDVVDSAIKPTLVEREQAQLWLMSTANSGATELMPSYRDRAMTPGNRSMIAEWSAPPNSDPRDPKVWQAASPSWSEGRLELMASSVGSTGFEEQWLNMWPAIATEEQWAASWPRLPERHPRGTLIAAVEAAYDRSCYGVAVCGSIDGIAVDAAVMPTETAAMHWLMDRRPAILMAGANIASRFAGPWVLKPCGSKETHAATPWFAGAIRDKELGHTHDPAASAQIAGAAATISESGPVISARRSSGPIPAAKAAAWASAAVGEDWYGLSQAIAVW